MKSLKRLFAVVLIITLFSGCTANNNTTGRNNSEQQSTQTVSSLSSNGASPIEIELAYEATSKAGITALVDQYNQMQDKVRVNAVVYGENNDPMMEKLTLQASTKQFPDVYTSSFNYDQFGIDNFPVVPVQTFIDKENYDLSDIPSNILDMERGADGKLYGMPYVVSSPILYVNEDMFKATGLDSQNLPKTWNELRETAKKLTKDDQYGIYIDYLNSTGNFVFESFLATAGGEMINDSGKAGFNSPEGKSALQFWCDLISEDKSMPNMDRTQATQLFFSGKLAMWIGSSSRLPTLVQGSNFMVETAEFPTVDGKPRRVAAGGYSFMITSNDPQKQAAAWNFIKYAVSPEGNTLYNQKTGCMTVRKSAIEKSELMGDYFKNSPNAKTVYGQMDDLFKWSSFPIEDAKIQKILKDNIIAALQKQKTVEQALKDAEEQANALLQ